MNISVYPVNAAAAVFMFLGTVSYLCVNSVYAANYEKSQTIVQTNECCNY
jgi:hypothetical protein